MAALRTCSQAIDFSQQLEEASASFYEQHAGGDSEISELFALFSTQNRKLATSIKRAYFSSISDAIEGCFAFQLEQDNYGIGALLSEPANPGEAVARAIELEQTIARYYRDASEQSKALLPEVSRSFAVAASRRTSRIETLGALAPRNEA